MIRVEGRVRVREEASRALTYLADFRHLPQWDPGIAEVRQLGGDGPAEGAVYRVVARFLGARIPMRYRTTHFDPEAGVAEIRGETPTLIAVDRITVRPLVGEGSAEAEVFWQADFTMKGPARLAERWMKPLFDRLGRKAMDGLRAKLG
ncbi:MAG: SRPBCC family protein [Sandaracinus sp.]|nr:SRPBCC family protein [Sandaracinus sp.]MCB9615741.1 SRPBCC family protein [Sandaracinus sp.]MCB9624009.1 SRPBCC family protein [Sandaracinus sp.]